MTVNNFSLLTPVEKKAPLEDFENFSFFKKNSESQIDFVISHKISSKTDKYIES